jgi:chorismate mutase
MTLLWTLSGRFHLILGPERELEHKLVRGRSIMDNDLNDLRQSLDNIDNAFIFLLAERFRVTQRIGIYKSEHGLSPVDEVREKIQFARIERLARDCGLNPEFAVKMLRLIIDEVIENHEAIRRERN